MSAPILQSNPKANYLAHQREIDEAIKRVLDSGWYILGQEVAAFEREFAAFLGAAHAVGVANGTDALALALRACGIGRGDAVITVSHTAVATVAAIELAGAEAVLVDINPVTFTMDPDRLEEAIRAVQAAGGPRLRAVIPVHLYGHPADLEAISAIASRHGLRVIEDCAQSHGAKIDGRVTGTFGDLAAFSFYPTKNLGALGDGGAVVTNDSILAEKLKSLREYGWRERYVSEVPGVNTRLDELQAAILRAKLSHLALENSRRRETAARYLEALDGLGPGLPVIKPRVEHVFHQFVIRTAARDGLRAWLKEQSIGTLIHYPVPVHLQPAYCGRSRVPAGGLAETERASREILSLPMHPHLAAEDAGRVCGAIKSWCDGGARS